MCKAFVFLLALVASGCSTMQHAVEPMHTTATDTAQVVETIRSMYVAATNDDLAKFHTVT